MSTQTINPHAALSLPQIDFQEYRLDNGLRVILHEDRSTPIVAVNLWYHVGSKNEQRGRTGFAHLFEHMMFQGSKHYDGDYFAPLQEAGGTLNGSTNSDRTNYWEVVPSNYLELALFLEADRMGFLLDAMTQAKLDNQRDVVKNEKRQNYDNRPYGTVSQKIAEAMYTPAHPYSWLTIGSMEDITPATLQDVQDFFRRFYTPNNASLCIAGDFKRTDVEQLIETHFGKIARGAEVAPVRAALPALERETRVEMTDRVTLARLYLVWHTVSQLSEDDAALDVLSSILINSKNSRLYRALVYERQLAQDVSAFHHSREIAGQFQIVATARPNHTLNEIEELIAREIRLLQDAPPSEEEMERAYNACESSFIYSLQTVGGFGGKADQLNLYATFLNDPGYFEKDLARYAAVTAEDVRRVARKYLTENRLQLRVLPQKSAAQRGGAPPVIEQTAQSAPDVMITTPIEAASIADSAPPTTAAVTTHVPDAQSQTRNALPQPRPTPKFQLPARERLRLSNGLDVLLINQNALPLIYASIIFCAGAFDDPPRRAGLASMTADLIDEGTETRTALDISSTLTRTGARLGAGAGWDASILSLLTLARHQQETFDLLADVTLRPTFPIDELKRLRQKRLTTLKQRRDNAQAVAEQVFTKLLYSAKHPYGHQLSGTEASVKAIKQPDVQEFYQTTYRPQNATMIVAGDARTKTILPLLEERFGSWQIKTNEGISDDRHVEASNKVNSVELTSAESMSNASRTRGRSSNARLYLVDRPDAAQSVIFIGQTTTTRRTPDYFALLVLNALLGGQFTSRINLNLREDKGYTYGARTSFNLRRHLSPFTATASVQTSVTKQAITELLRELSDIRAARPVTQKELDFTKSALVRGFPRGFETPSQLADRFVETIVYDLPDNYFETYIERVSAVTVEDVTRVANEYLDTERMTILVVGDRRKVENVLRSLETVGETLTLVDQNGRVERD